MSEDTIILQALAEAAKVFYAENFNLNLYFQDDKDLITKMNIDQTNAEETQKVSFKSSVDAISINANGTGLAILDFW